MLWIEFRSSALTLVGIIRYYDSDDSATITVTGSGVSHWADTQGSQGYTLTQTGDGSRPFYATSFVNGLDVIRFHTTDKRLDGLTLAGADSLYSAVSPTIYTAVNPDRSGATATRTIWGDVSNSDNDPGYRLLYVQATNSYQFLMVDDGGTVRVNLSADASPTGWDVVVVRDLGPASGVELEVVDVDSASVGSYTASTTTLDRFGVGATLRATPVDFFRGDLGQIVATGTTQSPTADAAFIDELVAKWKATPAGASVSTPALLTSGNLNSAADPKATASVTTTSGALVFAFLNSSVATTPGISGGGTTWTHHSSLPVVTGGNTRYLHTWTGVGGGSGAVSFSAPGTQAQWQITEVADAEVVQSATDQFGGTPLTQPFAAGFSALNNLTLAVIGSWNDSASHEGDMTTIHDSNFVAGVATCIHSSYRVGENLHVGHTADFATNAHAVAIFEIGPA